ncbi:LysR family transcriptional regulator [Ureibacillus manganicus]|uniref:LysR family transcriptional regulator n=1 Tax=Ureibacillus manganicus TaxID=1266064 RepID=UPI00056034E6|nr:LysR family transcriptional regulator [Ureibacillus manganicus]
MDSERLRYFVEVIEKGSISKAALSLNMTQPPLSIALKKLEEELGTPLFIRKGKKVIVNDTGKLLYKRGKELLLSTEQVKNEIVEFSNGKQSEVTIGCSTIANLTIIPEVVKRLNERNLKITIRVLEGNAAFILDQLRQHKMDIGIMRNIFSENDLHTTALLSENLYVALPHNHPYAQYETISLDKLSNENFLMPHTTMGLGISDFILEACQVHGYTPKIIYWGTETIPMLNMVKEGLGIAFAPELFTKLKDYKMPPLVKLVNPTISAKLNLVTLKNSVKSLPTEQFLEVTKEVINELAIE